MDKIKKLFSIIIAMVLLMECSSFAFADNVSEDVAGELNESVNVIANCSLIVNGKPLTDDFGRSKIYYNDQGWSLAVFPMVAVQKALGAKILWIGQNKALVFDQFTVAYLDIDKCFMWNYPWSFHPLIQNVLRSMGSGVGYVQEQIPLNREYVGSETDLMYWKMVYRVRITEDITSGTICINRIPLNETISFYNALLEETIQSLMSDVFERMVSAMPIR